MIGPILLSIFILVLFPVGISLSGAVVAALHGQLSSKDAEARYEGTEILELSKK